jgi:hypothetical protein
VFFQFLELFALLHFFASRCVSPSLCSSNFDLFCSWVHFFFFFFFFPFRFSSLFSLVLGSSLVGWISRWFCVQMSEMSVDDLRRRFEAGASSDASGRASTPSPREQDKRKSERVEKEKKKKSSDEQKKKKNGARDKLQQAEQRTMSLGRSSGKSAAASVAATSSSSRALPALAKSSGALEPLRDKGPPPPARPPKKRPDDGFSTERELMLEKKILELQMSQLQLVERLSTYEQHTMDEMRSSGGASGLSGSSNSSKTDLLGMLRKKLDKKKKAHDAMVGNEEMDASFWSPSASKRKVKLDLDKIEVLHPLTKDVGGSLCKLFVCEVDGFVCVLKELDIAFARELNSSLIQTFESEV